MKRTKMPCKERERGAPPTLQISKERIPCEQKTEDRTESYQWLKSIGKGTFGEVFKVILKRTGQKFAIKKVFQDPKFSNREFKIVQLLDHPCCIKVYDYFFTQDLKSQKTFLNVVMNYVPYNLHQIISHYKALGSKHPPHLD